jgi:hypothetical protein
MTDDRQLEASLARVLSPARDNDAAAQRVLARLAAMPLPAQKHGWFTPAWWPSALTDINFAPAWPRLAALACAAGLGITIGLSSVGMNIATRLDLVRTASLDESANLFDNDSLTGLRQ